MEFRFAAIQLRLPIIIAVVGTGNAWEKTEVDFPYYLLYFHIHLAWRKVMAAYCRIYDSRHLIVLFTVWNEQM